MDRTLHLEVPHPEVSMASHSALSRTALGLAAASLLGAAVASLVILLWDGSFPDPTPDPANRVLAEARGWSAVTLGLAVPLGAMALVQAGRGLLRGLLLSAGVLGYLVYTFLEFAVSPPFSALYLVYVATFALALPALAMTVDRIDVSALPAAFGERAPRRLVAAFALAFAALLSMAWLRGIVERLVAGDFGWPEGEAAVGHVVHALDLGLQVPLGLATGILLLRRRPAGWLVGSMFLVMSATMGPALAAMVGVASVDAGDSVLQATPFVVVAAIGIGLSVTWFRAIRSS